MASSLIDLSPQEKSDLIELAKRALSDHLDGINISSPNKPKTLSTSLERTLPCFVTLYSPNGRLRGCIGSMASESPLWKNVYEYAIRAGFEDPRFAPLSRSELKGLTVKISVIGPMVRVKSIGDVRLGEEGICVSKGSRRGVLLASVATDYGWSHEEFLKQTCVKAGLPPERASEYEVEKFQDYHFGE